MDTVSTTVCGSSRAMQISTNATHLKFCSTGRDERERPGPPPCIAHASRCSPLSKAMMSTNLSKHQVKSVSGGECMLETLGTRAQICSFGTSRRCSTPADTDGAQTNPTRDVIGVNAPPCAHCLRNQDQVRNTTYKAGPLVRCSFVGTTSHLHSSTSVGELAGE